MDGGVDVGQRRVTSGYDWFSRDETGPFGESLTGSTRVGTKLGMSTRSLQRPMASLQMDGNGSVSLVCIRLVRSSHGGALDAVSGCELHSGDSKGSKDAIIRYCPMVHALQQRSWRGSSMS